MKSRQNFGRFAGWRLLRDRTSREMGGHQCQEQGPGVHAGSVVS